MLADWPPGARWPSMGDPAEMMALATKLHEEKEIRRRHLQRWPCIALRSNLQSLFHHDDSIGAYRHRFVFHSRSDLIAVWNSALIFGVIYSTAYSPLAVVFPEARWTQHDRTETLLDVLFMLDVVIRFRTSFRDHGFEVSSPLAIARNYVGGWLAADLLSSLPVDRLLAVLISEHMDAPIGGRPIRISPISWMNMLSLLRILRAGRLVRKLSSLSGANLLRVLATLYLFVLFGHWLGLIWYCIAIRPIEDSEVFDLLKPWIWNSSTNNDSYFVAQRYVCSLYWALSAMTNLKGPPAHGMRLNMCQAPPSMANVISSVMLDALVAAPTEEGKGPFCVALQA